MLGFFFGYVKLMLSGYRGGVGVFINIVVLKFIYKIYIIFNFKKKTTIQILILIYQHSNKKPITIKSFHKSSSHKQIHTIPIYFIIPIKTKNFPIKFFFLSFFFLFLIFFKKQKLTITFTQFITFSPFPLNFYIYI